MNLTKHMAPHILAKFEYFAKQVIFSNFRDFLSPELSISFFGVGQ